MARKLKKKVRQNDAQLAVKKMIFVQIEEASSGRVSKEAKSTRGGSGSGRGRGRGRPKK